MTEKEYLEQTRRAAEAIRREALDRALQFHAQPKRIPDGTGLGCDVVRYAGEDEILATAAKFERYLSGRGNDAAK